MAASTSFGTFYQDYAGKIYAFLYCRVQHKQLAEDLTSQTFIKALEKFDQFDEGKGTFSAWIYQVARNTLTDHYRSHRSHSDIDTAEELRSDEDIAATVKDRESFGKVRDALQFLKPEQREVVLLRLWDGLSYQEIASVLGKSEAALKMTYVRSFKVLEQHLTLLCLLVAFLLFYHQLT